MRNRREKGIFSFSALTKLFSALPLWGKGRDTSKRKKVLHSLILIIRRLYKKIECLEFAKEYQTLFRTWHCYKQVFPINARFFGIYNTIKTFGELHFRSFLTFPISSHFSPYLHNAVQFLFSFQTTLPSSRPAALPSFPEHGLRTNFCSLRSLFHPSAYSAFPNNRGNKRKETSPPFEWLRAEGKGVGSTGDEVTRYLSLQKKKRNLGRISPKKKAKGCACEKKSVGERDEREREGSTRAKKMCLSAPPPFFFRPNNP